MEPKELITILQDQKNNLNQLFSAVSQKQRSLVSSNYELLEDSIMKEERILVNIQQSEKLRVKTLESLYKEFSISANSTRLQDFLEKTRKIIGDDIAANISRLENEIKDIIMRINNVNQQNKYLIEQSRMFIKETIQSVVNMKKKLLDRRV